ncbi:MAG: type II toxin-antitoxin system RelE/ParE family toxin [Anderseniella sp.]|jgi:mRNA interferase RelE/StbE|nr:type II toxin-antitoxin system RelE/ParE family toxin [Anderseniella sp.]
MKDVVYSRTAQKALMRMPRNWANRIRHKISAYAEDPGSQANNVRPLKGLEGVMRLRVGNWRILMRDEVVLLILDVKARGSAYKE